LKAFASAGFSTGDALASEPLRREPIFGSRLIGAELLGIDQAMAAPRSIRRECVAIYEEEAASLSASAPWTVAADGQRL
jgi:hypothetical protein